MMTVLQPGPLATVQDLGRPGVQAWGVTPGGAVDDLALRMGNWLVGNPEGAAAIEMTLQGMTIVFALPTLIAITGAPMEGYELDMHGARMGNTLPMWRPVWVNAGSILQWGRIREGVRSYLCVHGGIKVHSVLGGAGTDVRSGFGGHLGRPLQAGDQLMLGSQSSRYEKLKAELLPGVAWAASGWEASRWRDWRCGPARPIPWIPLDESATMLLAGDWRALPDSDRQGLRLSSIEFAESPARKVSHRSAGVCFGLVQLPPDGQPIVLLADHQTTGGYPVAGVVASVARSQLAQTRPGDVVQFVPVSLSDAHNALFEREQRLRFLRQQLHWRERAE